MYKNWKLNNGTKEKELQMSPDELVSKIMTEFVNYGDKALGKGKKEEQTKKEKNLETRIERLNQDNSELKR